MLRTLSFQPLPPLPPGQMRLPFLALLVLVVLPTGTEAGRAADLLAKALEVQRANLAAGSLESLLLEVRDDDATKPQVHCSSELSSCRRVAKDIGDLMVQSFCNTANPWSVSFVWTTTRKSLYTMVKARSANPTPR